MLLVVCTHQAIDVGSIPWTTLDGVLLIRAMAKSGTFDTKHRLRVHTTLHDIPLHLAFVIPPVEPPNDVPDELLVGYGLMYDKEVILYANMCDTEHDDNTTAEVEPNCGPVH